MSNTHNPKTAFSLEKENGALAEAWCQYLNNPKTGCDQLATALNSRLLQWWPDGSGERLIEAHAAEIRQDALILTLARYLGNNPKLQIASKRKFLPAIAREIERSLRGALNVVAVRTRRMARRRTNHISLQDIDEEYLPSVLHPSEYDDFLALAPDARASVVVGALRAGAEAKVLPRRAAELMARMVEGGLKCSDLAKEQKVSRQAIHQALEPARQFLRRHIQEQEFPITEPML